MKSEQSSKQSQSKASDIAAPGGKQQDNQNELFPVVGIGASAGGLEAFIQLLSHLPTDTGMAFVIVQHMSPNQESLLSVILSRSTQMPVSEVQTDMAVAPNHVYVIPPNVSMTIAQGVLKLMPRGRTRRQFMTVDTFLLSLAEERGSKAIAVILSGSDGDGTRGVEAIKAAGGVTFAQSQDTAKVDSMPNTAIATGQVDFILPPEKIAEKIAEIGCHPYIVDNLPTRKSPGSENAVVLVDIDELKRSAERLTQARDYAEAIVETVREPLLVLNLDLRVVTANHSFYETFQVAPTQIEQCLIFELGNGQWDIPKLRSLLAEILDRTVQFQDFEVEHDFEQIGQKTMLLNARKMPLLGDTQMILLAIEDITEQKRLIHQEQLTRSAAESANRAKDEFLSTLSHELRQPLTAMIGWAKLLRTTKLDEAQIEQGLETIERNANMQAQLIEDILDLGRISRGTFRLNILEIKLAPIIGEVIEIVRLAAETKNIQLESRLSPSTLKVLADPTRLQQVISNLLSNAIKFTPTGGRIEIILEYINAQAQIQISDTGQGIHADFLPYVFDRFRQADGSHSRSNPGLGLGLSIVRDLV
jgi:signal transduction histidine kinase